MLESPIPLLKGNQSAPSNPTGAINETLTPRLLASLGEWDLPEGSNFDPQADWNLSYRIWGNHSHRFFQNKTLGSLSLTRTKHDDRSFVLKVDLVVINAGPLLHRIEALLTCRADALATLQHWKYRSVFTDTAFCLREELTIEESGKFTPQGLLVRCGGREFMMPATRPIIAGWGIFDVLQRGGIPTNLRPGLEIAASPWSDIQWRYYLWAYDRMVEFIDAEIGRLHQALEATGQLENTVILFTSDHGERLGRHRLALKNFPYDAAARVPLIISHPAGSVRNGAQEKTLSSGLDLFPTICDFAEIAPPTKMAGLSLRAIAEGGPSPSRPYVAIEAACGRCIAIRSERYKYIIEKDDPIQMLFDMEKDPEETTNLAASSAHVETIRQHRGFVADHLSKIEVAPSIPIEFRWSPS